MVSSASPVTLRRVSQRSGSALRSTLPLLLTGRESTTVSRGISAAGSRWASISRGADRSGAVSGAGARSRRGPGCLRQWFAPRRPPRGCRTGEGGIDFAQYDFISDERWPAGPIVVGVTWDFSKQVVAAAASLATGLGLHLVCAFVDPASYLTEWEPVGSRTAVSLDPAANEEGEFPSGQLLQKLEAVLGSPGADWSFRVLNGDVAPALGRLAKSVGASLIVVGGCRPGILAAMDRFLEGSVSAVLVRSQWRPVLIIPCCA